MADDNVSDLIFPQTEPANTESKRERSTIEFPYQSLDDAVRVACGVHQAGGTGCLWEQLAAQINLAANGGAFRLQVITARVFGLVRSGSGRVELTPLGLRIVDQQQERQARTEAFLTVPLYKAIYEKFKGTQLPPPPGLEREMIALGVSSKQGDKARQAFMRSAKQAGFFEFSQDRLVLPANTGLAAPSVSIVDKNESPPKDFNQNSGGNGGGGEGLDPLIQGLISRLPKIGDEWPVSARAKWLRIAANAFDLIYGETTDEIEIKIKPLSEHH
jgi:hypothetical protein